MDIDSSSSSSSSSSLSSPWPDLPTDVLSSIADRLDPSIGILRLSSVCRSWRSSLSLSSSFHPQPSINFPLHLPFPILSPNPPLSPPPTHLSLLQRTLFLLSPPPSSFPSNGFLLKVEEIRPNTFSLIDPLGSKCSFKPFCGGPSWGINILDYGVSLICKSYVFEEVEGLVPFKKVVVLTDFVEIGDFVVLGLRYDGGLWFWRFGDENWTEIEANGRCFDDIVGYKGKFYASADRRGRLVMIDSRLKPIDMVHSLMYGCGKFTHLVVSDGELYLVDRVLNDQGLELGVFKLDEKGRFWDYELNLNEAVFFIGNDANFAVSKKLYGGCIRDCIYFIVTPEEDDEYHAVLNMKKGPVCSLVDSEHFVELYWPPWFDATAMDCSSRY